MSAFDARCEVASMMRAGVEMQLSGEPLAEAMGRDLGGYRRDDVLPDRHYDAQGEGVIDLAGYSTAVESYEYSKLAMNALSFESGAGTSMVFGQLTNPKQFTGAKGSLQLRNELQFYAASSDATERYVVLTDPLNPANPLGWPGIWPALHPFRSHDPTIAPASTFARKCSLASDDTVVNRGVMCADYECEYESLRLLDRSAQSEPVIGPGPSGWLAWKQALWAANYLLVMHDQGGNLVASVAEADLATVGVHANQVTGFLDDGSPGAVGVYLGSSDVEGFQAGMFIRAVDNQAEHWLRWLSTSDGVSLGGFDDLGAAWAYDRAAPLRWLPSAIGVSEEPSPPFFPKPSFTLVDGASRVIDVAGLLAAFAQQYTLCDPSNEEAGATMPVRAWFDGKPFVADDPAVPAEATAHDRSLAMIRYLVLTLDRVHRDPAGGGLSDDAPVVAGVPSPTGAATPEGAAYAIVALRTARLALTHRLSLYAASTPDTRGVTGALDEVPLGGDREPTISATLDAMIAEEAALLRDRLTTPEGLARRSASTRAAAGAAKGPEVSGAGEEGDLDDHAAAARGLYAAYLATGDTGLRERAAAVVARMNARFWDASLAVYVGGPAPADEVTYTPRRFGLVQAALREHYLLWASRPGRDAEAKLTIDRLTRLNKLVLNGWDDLDGDGEVKWPDECVRVEGGLPRGGLQMAERTMTGELGTLEADPKSTSLTITSDRDRDCVPEIDDARLPAQLAGSVTLRARRP